MSGRLWAAWRVLLTACFLVLCARFQWASPRAGPPVELCVTVILSISGLVLGFCFAPVAPFVFFLAVPWLSGLPGASLLRSGAPIPLLFSAVCLGASPRCMAGWCAPPAAGRDRGLRLAMGICDALSTAVLLSLLRELVRAHGFGRSGPFWSQASPPFGDPSYYLTSSFIWLQGLFFARWLCGACEPPMWARAAWQSTLGAMLFFVVVQFLAGLPPAYSLGGRWAAPYAPFEDIHSFGGFAVVLLVSAVAADGMGASGRRGLACALGAVAVPAALVAMSFSRATWLAAGLVLPLVALWRWPLRRVAPAAIGAAAVVAALSAAAAGPGRHWIYAERLLSLIRPQGVAAKDPVRFGLYQRAWAMIRSRPWTGHGTGSFYLGSIKFARAGDPTGALPNFAHDFLLQFAAEMGLPAAALLLLLAALVLVRGTSSAWPARRRLESCAENTRLAAGATAALAAYLSTQMTANAVNIYISNQFLFWFLVALILRAAGRRVTFP